MNANPNPHVSAPRLDAVSDDQLASIVGGTNMSFYDKGTKTGVIFNDGGGVEIWNDGVQYGTIAGGKFVPCTSHCTTA
jgi:hypothetical protein